MPEPTSEPRSEPTGRPRTAVLSATLAVLALVGGWTWAAAAQPGGFDSGAESISALAASGTATPLDHDDRAGGDRARPPRHGVGPRARAPRGPGPARRRRCGDPRGRRAAPPLPRRVLGGHTVVATASFALLAVWPWFAARPGGPWALLRPGGAARRRPCWPWPWPRSGSASGQRLFGLHERVVAFLTVAWPLVTAVSTWWWAGHRIGSRRVRHVLAVVGLTAGLRASRATSATAVAPATAQTRHYQASVALDPNPLSVGELVATTAFGDLRLEFQGLAPGIHAVPQVKANIAEVLSRPGVSLATLRPGPEELSAAIRDVARRGHAALRARGPGRRAHRARRVRRAPPTPSADRTRRGRGRRLAGLDRAHRPLALRDVPARPPGDLHLDRRARHAPAQPGHPQRRRDPGHPGGALPAQPHRPVDGAAAEVPGGAAGVGHLAAGAAGQRHPRAATSTT